MQRFLIAIALASELLGSSSSNTGFGVAARHIFSGPKLPFTASSLPKWDDEDKTRGHGDLRFRVLGESRRVKFKKATFFLDGVTLKHRKSGEYLNLKRSGQYIEKTIASKVETKFFRFYPPSASIHAPELCSFLVGMESGETYEFQAVNEDTADEWMNAINEAIDKAPKKAPKKGEIQEEQEIEEEEVLASGDEAEGRFLRAAKSAVQIKGADGKWHRKPCVKKITSKNLTNRLGHKKHARRRLHSEGGDRYSIGDRLRGYRYSIGDRYGYRLRGYRYRRLDW